MRTLGNAFQLGLKELRSLYRDPALLVLIVYAFTVAIYSAATAQPESPHRATLAVVDEDQSQVSQRILNAFQLPYFLPPEPIDLWQMDSGMDAGLYTFTLNIPPDFQADLLAGVPRLEAAVPLRAPSEGAEIVFRGTTAAGEVFTVPVFTTRPDTLCGVSFVVLAPEHLLDPGEEEARLRALDDPVIVGATDGDRFADAELRECFGRHRLVFRRVLDRARGDVAIGRQFDALARRQRADPLGLQEIELHEPLDRALYRTDGELHTRRDRAL